MNGTSIVSTITTAISDFVTGMAGAFVQAFQKMFLVEGSNGTFGGLNELGIFLLVFMGLSLGYGVIRFVSGLFRSKAE